MTSAICPGSYDPVTNGHVDVIRRAAAIFDRVVVGVVRDPTHKQPLFTVEERVAFLSGRNFSVGEPDETGFRLAYGQLPLDTLREGAARLGRALARHAEGSST